MDAQHEDSGQDGDSLRTVRGRSDVVCPFLSALASVAGCRTSRACGFTGQPGNWRTRRAVHYSARNGTLTAGCGTVQR